MPIHLALDVGGTFTDLVAFDDVTGAVRQAKSSTTPEDLTLGIARCIAKAEIPLSECSSFVHGATIAINTVIERSGARTVLVTTNGARDAYLIGRGNRPEAYNVFFTRPEPLVSRSHIIEVDERILADGSVLRSMSPETLERLCERVAALKPDAIAVCLLHSYVNPSHEQRIGEVLRSRMPSVYVSLSHEILRQYREYERTSTTVVNSYIGPRVSGYLRDLEARFAAEAFGGTMLIMQSNGGVTSVSAASRVPVALMESGPVGGINASALTGQALGYPEVIAFDMGGTTAKASLIRSGVPATAEGYYVGGYASGHPVMLPVVDVVEVGAGGGSIGWIDDVGALKVGPRSAGASPGPVSYGKGGTEPTLTDANVVLGRIDPSAFLGGEMPLDREAARRSIEERIATPLGMTVEEASLGMLRIAIASMTLAVRGVSIERGYDPRDFTMVVSGGNGGLHGPLIARELSIPRVVVPMLPAHFSAVGMLLTDIRHDYVRTHAGPIDEIDMSIVSAIFNEFSTEGLSLLANEGIPENERAIRLSFDLRYIGQEYYLNVPVESRELTNGGRQAVRERFDETHKRNYSQSAVGERVELVNVRVSAVGIRPKPSLRPSTKAGATAMGAPRQREVFLDSAVASVTCDVFSRGDLPPGAIIDGPSIVEESATTSFVPAGAQATIAQNGDLVIQLERVH